MKKCPYCGTEFADNLATCPADGHALIDPQTERSAPEISPVIALETNDFVHRLFAATPTVWATPLLLGANIIVFVLMVLSEPASILNPTTGHLIRWGADFGLLTASGQWWRIFTSCFVHIGIVHLGMNMIVLYYEGFLAERMFGSWLFLGIYLAAGLSASLCSMWFNPDVICAGASGAIFGIYGAVGSFLLRRRASLPASVFVRLGKSTVSFVGANLLIGLSLVNNSGSIHIDMAAHLGGMLCGFVYGFAAARPLEIVSRRTLRLRAAIFLTVSAAVVMSLLGLKARSVNPARTQGYLLLASLYREGRGVKKDLHASAGWFRKAAEHGDIRAQIVLADMLLRDPEIKNPTEALQWLHTAADHGETAALWQLALIHLRGEGVKTNNAEALKWLLKLEERGVTEASLEAGRIYFDGAENVPRDLQKAFQHFLRAGQLGNRQAFNVLGGMYLQGEGTPPDLIEAYKWLSLADHAKTNAPTQSLLRAIEKELTPAQRAEAVRRLEEFKRPKTGKPAQ